MACAEAAQSRIFAGTTASSIALYSVRSASSAALDHHRQETTPADAVMTVLVASSPPHPELQKILSLFAYFAFLPAAFRAVVPRHSSATLNIDFQEMARSIDLVTVSTRFASGSRIRHHGRKMQSRR